MVGSIQGSFLIGLACSSPRRTASPGYWDTARTSPVDWREKAGQEGILLFGLDWKSGQREKGGKREHSTFRIEISVAWGAAPIARESFGDDWRVEDHLKGLGN